VSAEILKFLNKARLRGERTIAHANKHGQLESARELANIAYHATNPDYCASVVEAEAWLLTQEIERELLKYYDRGVCCFSTTHSSALLWSHYGDQHRGICIGYGTDRIPKPELQKVVYGGSRVLSTSTIVNTFVHDDRHKKTVLDREVLLRKAKEWSYEKEWRLIGARGLQDSPLLLKEITFGLRCPSSVIHAVIQSLSGRQKPVQFYQIHEAPKTYALRRRPVDIDELTAYLPKTAESGEEIFGPYTSHDNVKPPVTPPSAMKPSTNSEPD
jgi:hypothetical protein